MTRFDQAIGVLVIIAAILMVVAAREMLVARPATRQPMTFTRTP